MRLSLAVWSFVLLTALSSSTSAQTKDSSSIGRAYVLEQCLILPISHARVPAKESGILVALPIREGSTLKSGQLIARIGDNEARVQKRLAELENTAAKIRLEDDIDTQIAKKAAELTKVDFTEAKDAKRRVPEAISDFE